MFLRTLCKYCRLENMFTHWVSMWTLEEVNQEHSTELEIMGTYLWLYKRLMLGLRSLLGGPQTNILG